MNNLKWTKEMDNLRIQLKDSGCSNKEIAKILSTGFNINVSPKSVRNRNYNAKRTNDKTNEYCNNNIHIYGTDEENIRHSYGDWQSDFLSKLPKNESLEDSLMQTLDKHDNNSKQDNMQSTSEYKVPKEISFEDSIETNLREYGNKLFDDKYMNNSNEYILSEKIKKEIRDVWRKFQNNKYKKILVLSDLHAPYVNFKKLNQALVDNMDCDICVLNGDILDCECMSKYDKMNEIEINEEFKQIYTVMDVLTKRFKYIIWINGNHDGTRFVKYISRNIKQSLRQYALEKLDPIKHITDKYSNIIHINHNFCEIGDAIFCHPNFYNSPEMKTVVNECDILLANKHDLPNQDFRAVVMGHTHDGSEYYKNGIKLMETCCMCYTPDYRLMNPTKRIWTTGYARVELENNKIVFNKSHIVYLDD